MRRKKGFLYIGNHGLPAWPVGVMMMTIPIPDGSYEIPFWNRMSTCHLLPLGGDSKLAKFV